MLTPLTKKEARTLLESIAPIPKDVDPRTLDAATRYAQGETFQSISEKAGVTRERVRQLIKASPWEPPAIREKLAYLHDERAGEVAEAVQAWSQNNPGAPLSEGSKTLRIDEAMMRSVLGARARSHMPTASKKASTRATKDDIVAALRRCHKETGSLTLSTYAQWARDNGCVGPQTAAQRFGSWAAAVNASGVRKARKIDRHRAHSEQDLWAALVEGLRHNPSATAEEWANWASETPGMPSLTTLRMRLHLPWSQLRDEGMLILAGRSDRDADWVQDVLRERDWEALREQKPDFDPIAHLRDAVSAVGPDLTMQTYNEWAEKNGRPTLSTLRNHSDLSWPDMLEAAGGHRRRAKVAHLSDEQIAESIRDFYLTGLTGNVVTYQQWAAENQRVSIQTLFRRVGPWSSAQEWSQRVLSGDSGKVKSPAKKAATKKVAAKKAPPRKKTTAKKTAAKKTSAKKTSAKKTAASS